MARSLIGKAAKALANRSGDTFTSPVPYVAAGPSHFVFGGLPGNNDAVTYMRTFGTVGTVFQIVSLLAQSTATPEWKLYRKAPKDGRVRYTTGDRGTDQRVEVVTHPALSVWTKPNAFYTRHELVETTTQHLELTGEGWWVLHYPEGSQIPISMWPVRPDRIEPVPDPETFIKGYVYTSPDGEQVPLDTREVIQIKYPNPLDPYRGMGPVQSVLVQIDAMKYGAEWNRNFFINSATPGGIIQVDGRLDDGQWDELTNRWRESHQGVARAHRVAVLEGGAKWVERQYSMRDMQFAELQDVSRDVLREAWGIHKSMLGLVEDVNRANAETAEEVFGRWKILPRLDRIRMTLNERFLPLFYPPGAQIDVEFDYVNPLRDDRDSDNAELTAKTTAYAVLVQAGVDPVDAAEVVGLPPMRMTAPALPAPSPEPGASLALPPAPEPAKEPVSNALDPELAGLMANLRDVWNELSGDPA